MCRRAHPAFQFKGKAIDISEIGARLKVESVLEGSVRKAGNRLRITAQLVSVGDGYHLWSERYDRDLDDVFAVQDEIARAIVEQLKVQLGGEAGAPLVRRGTDDLEALQPVPAGSLPLVVATRRLLPAGGRVFRASHRPGPRVRRGACRAG